jgi:hypothetical protein
VIGAAALAWALAGFAEGPDAPAAAARSSVRAGFRDRALAGVRLGVGT